jgi:menaquinone-dependent protoporphyrinogen oxidase
MASFASRSVPPIRSSRDDVARGLLGWTRMSKILVVYASTFGQTRAIALRIAELLRQRAFAVDLVDARYATPSPEGYDTVVLGSRVQLGRHAASVVRYMREHRDVLERVPTAFFSVSMAASSPGAGPDPSGYLANLFDELGWRPTRAIAFAGGLPYRKYGWLLRLIMKRISKSAGHTIDTTRDHELTDWRAVHGFVDDIAASLQPTATTGVAGDASRVRAP